VVIVTGERQDLPSDYRETLIKIKERIRTAQYTALRAVNKQLIQLYWDIGKTIVERQKADPSSWGKAIVEWLSSDLQKDFPDIRGLSSRNIWRMRNFFLEYRSNEKLPTLSAEIPWSHNTLILEKCKDNYEREFYIKMCKKSKWSYRILQNQILSKTYERTMINQTNFDTTLADDTRDQAHLSLKDEYSFNFLEMGDEYSERRMEKAIIRNLPNFLREMGGVFAFIGNQYRLEVNHKEYSIDLLLFHRKLRCLVAIDLKVGEFKPEHVGKMQFYLSALEEHVKENGENPPIGIILCKDKDRTSVEYTLRLSQAPLGVSKYRTVEELPHDLEDQLPRPEQIERLLLALER
jgi:predicted nuclease of restriction endonuclease-like (RecB) superfamily